MPPLSEYRLKRRVQFYETDAAGIVHFSWFFRYMEEAEHAMWRAVGLSVAPPGSEIGWPRVAASFEFHRALRVTAIGTKTIQFACVLTRNETRIATGALTIACASQQPNQPLKGIPIPPDIAARFQVAAGLET